MKKQYAKLPKYPSELLQLALDDISEIKYDDRYIIDMDYWHSIIKGTDTCGVCLAGAVIANTLKVDIETSIGFGQGDVDSKLGKRNGMLIKTINGLRLLDLYYVYNEHKSSLTEKEETLIRKCYESIGKKLKEYTDNPDMDVDEEDIIEFKNFDDAYNFYSSIISDIAHLDDKILGRTA